MLVPRSASWRPLWLLGPCMLAVACHAPRHRGPEVVPLRAGSTVGSTAGSTNLHGAPSGVEGAAAPNERSFGVGRTRAEPFDRRLLPPPSIGGYTPMAGEALLSQQAPESARQDGAAAQPQQQEPEHWSGLPLLADMARRHDVQLPVPVGVSVNYSAINRPSRVDRVRAGVNGGPLQELPSLSFEAEAKVQILVGRVDAWVLPMLNVYLLGGYVWNESSVDLTVDLPFAPNTTFRADGNLEGPVYGGGTTLAGGYGRYFLLADINFNKVELGGLSEMDAILTTARVGYSANDLDWIHELRIYLATTYWDTARTISGTLNLGGGGPINTIQYAVDQSPVDPMTFGAGVHLGINRHNSVVLEAQGYEDTFYFVGGFVFRF